MQNLWICNFASHGKICDCVRKGLLFLHSGHTSADSACAAASCSCLALHHYSFHSCFQRAPEEEQTNQSVLFLVPVQRDLVSMYFIVKNLRRQIEIPPDKFGRMIDVFSPASVNPFKFSCMPVKPWHSYTHPALQNVLASELQKAVEGQVHSRDTASSDLSCSVGRCVGFLA
jgi:hypothetical protein